MKSRIVIALTGVALALAVAPPAPRAQNFPTKPVQLMVAYPPGGSTDVGARIVASIAEKRLASRSSW